jgi:endonuclease YncB( thermonuclease family)
MRLSSLFVLGLFFTLAVGAASPSWAVSAFVLWVTDGDTVTVIDSDFHLQRVRVYGIDCPESDQPYGFTARLQTAWEVWVRPVTLIPHETDRYGRLVARIQRDGRDLSASLIASGLAWVYDAYCTQEVCRRWKRLETEARKKARGLWSDPGRVPPWDWRRGKRPDNGWRLW